MIIALIGAERVGKDTFADILVNEYGFKKHSMADPIREISKVIFPGWFMENGIDFALDKDNIEPGSGICPRDFMKWLGTDIFQIEFHKRFPSCCIPERSIWSEIGANKIIGSDKQTNWVIPDVRFKHEAHKLIQLGCHFINLVPSTEYASCGGNFYGQSTYDIPFILQNYPNTKIINDKTSGVEHLKKQVRELISGICPNGETH
jgi:hypothetical protein